MEFSEMMALARLADKQAPMVPLPHPKPRKSKSARGDLPGRLLCEMAVYRAWSRRVGGAGGWSNKTHEIAMALSLKHVAKRVEQAPPHLRDFILSDDVIWDTYTLSIEHLLRYYDHNRGATPMTFLCTFCSRGPIGQALAQHVPGRLHGRYMHNFSEASVLSLEGLREKRAAAMGFDQTRVGYEERDQDRFAADIERLDAGDAVKVAMEVLTDDERDIIHQHYFKHRIFREIAETRILTWGPEKGTRCVSLQRIQNIHAGALAKMRRVLEIGPIMQWS